MADTTNTTDGANFEPGLQAEAASEMQNQDAVLSGAEGAAMIKYIVAAPFMSLGRPKPPMALEFRDFS